LTGNIMSIYKYQLKALLKDNLPEWRMLKWKRKSTGGM
jgi:hypothetical protein